MNETNTIIAVSALILVILDGIYLLCNKQKFEGTVISIQKTSLQPRYISILGCYILLIAGLWYLILRSRRSPIEAAVLGIVIYGVFETTTYAIFKNWPWYLVFIDTLWGGVLFGLTTALTYKVIPWISNSN
jgi:uncharacterized membrane protein